MRRKFFTTYFLFFITNSLLAQPITGVWHGKVGRTALGVQHELKLVQKGDSLVGTSYYYKGNNWTRYSIKGYFDPNTNSVIWWDDEYLDGKTAKFSLSNGLDVALEVEANYNCPGGGKMLLEGKANVKKGDKISSTEINLEKKGPTVFKDEWDIIIDNWLVGGNDRALIDSVQLVAFQKQQPIFTPIDKNNAGIVYQQEKNQTGTTTVLDVPIQKSAKATSTENKTTPLSVNDNPAAKKPPMEFLDLSKPDSREKINEQEHKTKNAASEIVFAQPQLVVQPTAQSPSPAVMPTIDFLDLNKTDTRQTPVATVPITEPAKTTPQPSTISIASIGKETTNSPTTIQKIAKPTTPTINNIYTQRQKQILTELPLADSIELHFYDNAEVDGDSIALFLDDKLLYEHIRLSDRPYVVTLTKELLSNAKELTMVAENLGAIPPNTSFMVAFINGQRYEATLSSTERSSAVIRFKK
jgi:hypothetical protein